MSIPQISPTSVLASPAELNPQVQASQLSTIAKAGEAAQKASEEKKSDSVTISRQALSKSSEVLSHSAEAKERHSEKVKEKQRGNRE
jgi:hypothetical protein